MNKPKIIAFYLPQYHPTTDNDKWWGKGFTEWTNVGKAKPLFKGHYQPRVPADLGYYDLRLSEVREQQADLAKEAGIYGFCYYHYWFGNGKQELELPFNEVLRLGKPDFPFCLCWANESWHSKFWDKDGSIKKKMLIEQTYPGKEDHISHFNTLLPAFKDDRYIKINGKPLFTIYKALEFTDIENFIKLWQKLAQENGFPGIYFIAQNPFNNTQEQVKKLLALGFDAINTIGLWDARKANVSIFVRIRARITSIITGLPFARKYEDIYSKFISDIDSNENVYPTLIPNWDHTPRSGAAGYVLLGSTPNLFRKHIKQVFEVIKNKKTDNQIIFLKSWNEWGEGNYMEPDLKFGKGYIEVLKEEIDIL